MKKYMDLAILEALKSGWNGYIPVGGLIVQNNKIIKCFTNNESINHCEISMRNYIYNNRLENIDLYITMEPCIMCWFLLNELYPYINKIIFGVFNEKYGGITHKVSWCQKKYIQYINFNEDRVKTLLKGFFYLKRN
jgi:tRNA(Arg) A34 adenosine deaminase TadA